ncbi:MAG: ferrochelatase, partial [Clostridia bacterium]|nr:ferrochelatase [Clostridia bacterium]
MAIAVLVMAYGTPDRLEDVEAYYTHICGGRRPRPELLAELIGRYRAIGGRSPLTEITARQALALEAKLKERGEWRVYMAMKHWHPFIADTVERMVADGVRAAVGLPLSPLISPAATGGYETAALAAADGRIRWRFPPSWHTHPLFVEAVAQRVRRALRLLPAADQPTPVVFTAHSLPVSAVLAGDPYPH